MNYCHNCRYKNKDIASKTCEGHLIYKRPYCLNWKKERWIQKIINKFVEVI